MSAGVQPQASPQLAEDHAAAPAAAPAVAPAVVRAGGSAGTAAGNRPGVDAKASGERIERLLEASASAGPVARERAEELIRLVVDLYGAGLERMLTLAYDAGVLSDPLLEAFAADDLVASLLLVHGLHPYPVEDRIARALEQVRPYLGSHGGDVELLEVTDAGIARLRLLGSCDGCPSSAATLSLAVEGAVTGAAPEVVSIEVVEESAAAGSSFVPIDALSVRLREPAGPAAAGPVSWEAALALDELPPGAVQSVTIAGQPVALARIGPDVFAYRDGCPACGGQLAGAALERQLGGTGVVLTCPACRAHYDIRRAGAALDGGAGAHLDPLPLLLRDGVVEVAVRSAAATAAAGPA